MARSVFKNPYLNPPSEVDVQANGYLVGMAVHQGSNFEQEAKSLNCFNIGYPALLVSINQANHRATEVAESFRLSRRFSQGNIGAEILPLCRVAASIDL